MVAADDAPRLVAPTADTAAEDAAIALDGRPRPGPAEIDINAAGQAALAQVARFEDAEWDMAAVAASLGTDAIMAFGFVRDRIGFEPYRGVLRGTLAARAGNSWDRALLLQALLVGQGHRARLASGEREVGSLARTFERALDWDGLFLGQDRGRCGGQLRHDQDQDGDECPDRWYLWATVGIIGAG